MKSKIGKCTFPFRQPFIVPTYLPTDRFNLNPINRQTDRQFFKLNDDTQTECESSVVGYVIDYTVYSVSPLPPVPALYYRRAVVKPKSIQLDVSRGDGDTDDSV